MHTITAKNFVDFLSGTVAVPANFAAHIRSSAHHIEFKELKVTGIIDLSGLTITRKVGIESGEYHLKTGNAKIQNSFWITGGEFKMLEIKETEVTGEGMIAIRGGNFANVLDIKGGIHEKGFSISGGTFKYGMRIHNATFKRAFQITGGDFSSWVEFRDAILDHNIMIHSSTFGFGLQIRTSKIKNVMVWECPGLRLLSFRVSSLGSLSIKAEASLRVFGFSSKLTVLNLRDTVLAKDVSLLFTDVKINHLRFDRFYNFGYICFNNLMPLDLDGRTNVQLPASRLSMVNCNLGKLDFNGCDLGKFEVEFENAKILEMNLLGGVFNAKIEKGENFTESDFHEQIRLFNGQMKKVFENKGDLVASANAHTDDMNAYYKTLAWTWWPFWKSMNWEMVNLWLNWASTNHGKSWRRGFGALFIVGLILFWLYAITLGYKFAGFNDTGWKEFGKLMSYYLEFLNPIHKADYIADDLNVTVTGWSRFWEGLSRVVIAYFVYQLIQAFRKHGKKSL